MPHTHATARRVLNAKPSTDPRNRNYPTRAVVRRQIPRPKTWAGNVVLNQGQTPACTGFAGAADLIAAPQGDPTATARQGNELGMLVYTTAISSQFSQDGVEAVSIGAQYAVDQGLIGQYRWPTSLADLRDVVIASGPVTVVVPWYPSMFTPSGDGLLTVRRNGESGSHCLIVRGYHPARKVGRWKRRRSMFLLRNTWGRSWGINGDAWMLATDLDALIRESGGYQMAACHAIGRNPVNVARLLTT